MNKVYIIAVFRTRTYTYGYFNELKKHNIRATIVDTPQQGKVACGISVKFAFEDWAKAQQYLKNYKSGFVSFLRN